MLCPVHDELSNEFRTTNFRRSSIFESFVRLRLTDAAGDTGRLLGIRLDSDSLGIAAKSSIRRPRRLSNARRTGDGVRRFEPRRGFVRSGFRVTGRLAFVEADRPEPITNVSVLAPRRTQVRSSTDDASAAQQLAS